MVGMVFNILDIFQCCRYWFSLESHVLVNNIDTARVYTLYVSGRIDIFKKVANTTTRCSVVIY